MSDTPLKTIGNDTRDTMWLCRFDGTGAANWLQVSDDAPPVVDPAQMLGTGAANAQNQGFIWVHVDLVDARARNWVQGMSFIPESLRELFLASQDRRGVTVDGSAMKFSLLDSALNFDTPTDEMTYLHCIVGDNYVITGRRKKMAAAAKAIVSVDSGRLFPTPLSLIGDLTHHIIDRLESMSIDVSDELDAIENRVLRGYIKTHTAQILGPLLLDMAHIHRHTLILRRTIFQLSHTDAVPAVEQSSKVLSTHHERLDELDRDTVAEQRRAKILQDEIATRIANESSRSLFVIAIVTTFFFPLVLVTDIITVYFGGTAFLASNPSLWTEIFLLGIISATGFYLLNRFIHLPRTISAINRKRLSSYPR